MDDWQFQQQIRDDVQLSALVQEVAEEIGDQIPSNQQGRYIVGVDDALLALATYAIFRWAKDYLDFKRAKNETEIAERRARIVTGLTKEGFDPEKAQAVTEGLLKQIAKRSEDDPMLQKALALLGAKEN